MNVYIPQFIVWLVALAMPMVGAGVGSSIGGDEMPGCVGIVIGGGLGFAAGLTLLWLVRG